MNIGNIYFMAEILAGEMIFLYPVPKRKGFAFRLPLCCVLSLLIAAFLPRSLFTELFELSALLRFIGLFLISVSMMFLCFSLPGEMLFSMCTAGYAAQHYSYRVAAMLARLPILPDIHVGTVSRERLFEIVIIMLCYLVTLLTFGRFSARNECYKNSDRRFNYLAILIIFICVGLTRISGLLGEGRMNVTSSVYSIICCLLALHIQFHLHRLNISEREKTALDQIRREEKKQYEITKNAMDSINIKVHDLKHKLSSYSAALPREEIESIKRDVDVYDSSPRTGLDALDVLLSEKLLKCKAEGIQMSVSGNWQALSFMRPMDVYSLFGNAIDNAIEAVEKLEDPEKKIIDASIEQRGDMLFLSFTNYFDGHLLLSDGLPLTRKETEIGYHGYGMKSMKLIAEKYGGELAVSANEDVFALNVYLSCPPSA